MIYKIRCLVSLYIGVNNSLADDSSTTSFVSFPVKANIGKKNREKKPRLFQITACLYIRAIILGLTV
jgi:hypothetical protein